MNRDTALRFGKLLVAVVTAIVALLFALLEDFLRLAGSADDEPADDRRIYDSDMIGEYNYRTGRLDAGVDPYGWYDREED